MRNAYEEHPVFVTPDTLLACHRIIWKGQQVPFQEVVGVGSVKVKNKVSFDGKMFSVIGSM